MLFVSYSSKDEPVVRQLVEDLERARFEVWLDEELRGGDVWWDEILERIRGSEVFLFALSTNARQSKPCRAELKYARALGLPILPVQIGEVDSVRTLPISDLQIVPYGERTVSNAMALVAAVQDTARARKPLPDPLPEAPSVPYAYLLRLSTAIDATALTMDEQGDLVRQLRSGLEDEEEESVREDIRTLLRALRRRGDLTVRNAADIDALLAPVGAAAVAPAREAAQAERSDADAPKVALNRPVGPAPRVEPAPPLEQRRELPDPGWYPDPMGEARLRYWDGTAWTSHRADRNEAPPPPPPPTAFAAVPAAVASLPPPPAGFPARDGASGAKPEPAGNGWSIAAMVCAGVALLLPFVGLFAIAFGIVGKVRKERLGTAGLVVSIALTVVAWILWAVIYEASLQTPTG